MKHATVSSITALCEHVHDIPAAAARLLGHEQLEHTYTAHAAGGGGTAQQHHRARECYYYYFY